MFFKFDGFEEVFLDLVEADFFETHADAHNQDRQCSAYLSHVDWLIEEKKVGDKGVDDVHEANQRDKTGISTLIGYCLGRDCNTIHHSCHK